jgi:hypothetical protein
VVNATDATRRAVPPFEAAQAVASLLSLLSDPRGAGDLREVAGALRQLAGTLDRIAARRESPCPGGAYDQGWGARPGG